MRLHGATGVGVGVVTGRSDVEEVGLCAQFSEGAGDVRLEVVPAETEVLRGTHLEVSLGGGGRGVRSGCVIGRRQMRKLKAITF